MASDGAGATTGTITSSGKVGTAVYQLTGTLSGTDSNGTPIANAASATTTFNIHVVEFTVSIADFIYSVGTAALYNTYTITYSPVHAEVPVFTYTAHTLLEDVGSGYAAQVYLGATLETATS